MGFNIDLAENVKSKEGSQDGGQGGEGYLLRTPSNQPEQQRQGERLWCVHIKATFNNTFIHVTDLSGRETYARITGGMKVKADREESSPYAAMLAAVDIVKALQVVGINAIHIKLRGM